jgi:hypothetical protein
VVHVDDAVERTKRQIGRPSTVQNFRKQVVEILEETPGSGFPGDPAPGARGGISGGKTALYDLVARFAPSRPNPWCVSKAFLESSASPISEKSR